MPWHCLCDHLRSCYAVTVCGVLLSLTLFTSEMKEYLAPFSVHTVCTAVRRAV